MCPDENQLLAWCQGTAADAPAIAGHVDGCSACLLVVGAIQPVNGEPAAELPALGALLNERYRVLQQVGSGAMGVVFRGFDLELEREVALKLVKSRADDLERRSGLEEARALARLNHPNVVAVYDAFAQGRWDAIAMEFVQGQDLRAWLQAPHPRAEVEEVLRQAALGLEAAHRANIVHRDFKPANVLVGHDGRVRVTDFGLSRSNRRLTPGGGLMTSPAGTPAYMAPEQSGGRPASAASDQYALCLTALEALTGSRSGTPRLMPWSRGLSEDPALRWPSLTALLASLTARRRARRIALVATLALLAGVLSLALWQLRPPPEPSECGLLRAQLASVANPAALKTLDGALAESAPPGTRNRALQLFTGHLGQLQTMLGETCQAERDLEKGQLQTARLACLGRTLDNLEVTRRNALEGGGPGAQGTLAYHLLHLDPRQRCGEDRRVRAQALSARGGQPSPIDGEIDSLESAFERREMALVRAQVGPLLSQARGLGAKWVIPRLLSMRAAIHHDDDQLEAARADLDEAIGLAEVEGLDLLSLTLSRERLAAARSVDEAQAWLGLTRARARRLGIEAVMEGDLLEASGLALWSLGELGGAAARFAEATKVWRAQLSDDDVMVASVEQLEGRALAELGRFEEAEPLLVHSSEVMLLAMGPDSLHLLDAWAALARLELMRERPGAASTHLERSRALRERLGAAVDEQAQVAARWLSSLRGGPPPTLPELEPDSEAALDLIVIERLERLARGDAAPIAPRAGQEGSPMEWLATALAAELSVRRGEAPTLAQRVLDAPESRTGRLARAHALAALNRREEALQLLDARLLSPSRPVEELPK